MKGRRAGRAPAKASETMRIFTLLEKRSSGWRPIGRVPLFLRPEAAIEAKKKHGGFLGTARVPIKNIGWSEGKYRFASKASVDWKVFDREQLSALIDELTILRVETSLSGKAPPHEGRRALEDLLEL